MVKGEKKKKQERLLFFREPEEQNKTRDVVRPRIKAQLRNLSENKAFAKDL